MTVSNLIGYEQALIDGKSLDTFPLKVLLQELPEAKKRLSWNPNYYKILEDDVTYRPGRYDSFNWESQKDRCVWTDPRLELGRLRVDYHGIQRSIRMDYIIRATGKRNLERKAIIAALQPAVEKPAPPPISPPGKRHPPSPELIKAIREAYERHPKGFGFDCWNDLAKEIEDFGGYTVQTKRKDGKRGAISDAVCWIRKHSAELGWTISRKKPFRLKLLPTKIEKTVR